MTSPFPLTSVYILSSYYQACACPPYKLTKIIMSSQDEQLQMMLALDPVKDMDMGHERIVRIAGRREEGIEVESVQ